MVTCLFEVVVGYFVISVKFAGSHVSTQSLIRSVLMGHCIATGANVERRWTELIGEILMD